MKISSWEARWPHELAHSTPERALRVRALAGDIVLCSWARHFTLTVPLSIQVYKWVLVNLMLGVTLRWTSIPSRGGGGVEILPVASCYRNLDKLRSDGPLGSNADFTWYIYQYTIKNKLLKIFLSDNFLFIFSGWGKDLDPDNAVPVQPRHVFRLP